MQQLLISSEQKIIDYIQLLHAQATVKTVIKLIDELIISVGAGNLNSVGYLDINYVDLYEKSALLYACELNSIALVQYLITKFPNIIVRMYDYIDFNNWQLDPIAYCIKNDKNYHIITILFTRVEIFKYYYEEFIDHKFNILF